MVSVNALKYSGMRKNARVALYTSILAQFSSNASVPAPLAHSERLVHSVTSGASIVTGTNLSIAWNAKTNPNSRGCMRHSGSSEAFATSISVSTKIHLLETMPNATQGVSLALTLRISALTARLAKLTEALEDSASRNVLSDMFLMIIILATIYARWMNQRL